jgi:hypothetical protein
VTRTPCAAPSANDTYSSTGVSDRIGEDGEGAGHVGGLDADVGEELHGCGHGHPVAWGAPFLTTAPPTGRRQKSGMDSVSWSMWLFSDIGFFSAVAHRDNADAIVVRTRARGDLEALRERLLPDLAILDTPAADYAHRAIVPRDDWAYAVCRLAETIDYPNFKDAVAARQGPDRADRYLEIWHVMQGLQAEER